VADVSEHINEPPGSKSCRIFCWLTGELLAYYEGFCSLKMVK